MTFPIRTVKKEIRILGVDTCRKNQVFGAIVRGGFFLDGAVRFPSPPKDLDRAIATSILGIKHYPELRAIMLHNPSHRLNSAAMERLTRLPVMEISAKRQNAKGFVPHGPSGRTIWYRTRLPQMTAKKILSVVWTTGRLPEPARVAHLLSRSIPA